MPPRIPNLSKQSARTETEAVQIDRASNDFGAPPSISPAIRKSISGRQYSCIVSNLEVQFIDETNDNTRYQTDINGYLPLPTPKLTKAGKIAAHQPYISKQPVKWWKAQCGFRGLPVNGNLRDLQDRIRGHGEGGLSKTMKEACVKLKEDYVLKNDGAVEQIWIRGDKNEKAKLWPKRLLCEFLEEHRGSDKETLVVEVDDWGEKIQNVSRDLRISCEMRKMPDYRTGQRLVVLGLNEQSVRSKIAETDRDIQRSTLRARQEKELYEQEGREDFDRRFHLAQSKKGGLKGEWNVSGEWEISCPHMEQQWGSEDNGCSLEIRFTKPNKSDLVQMFASFDFIAITGIFRFVNPGGLEDRQEETKKQLVHEETDEEDCTDDKSENSDDHESASAQFVFPKSSLPSSNTREFNFRWRGEETGEGEIQLQSDEKLCPVTFESPGALSGVFISGLAGKVEFKGIKQKSETKVKRSQKQKEATDWLNPDDEWRSRNEAAYESASKGRWGRRGRWG